MKTYWFKDEKLEKNFSSNRKIKKKRLKLLKIFLVMK